MQTFATTAPISTVVTIPAGRVQVIAAERADTTVEVRPAEAGKSRDVTTAEQTTIAYDGETLRVATAEPEHPLFGHAGAVEVTIQVPAGSHVEVRSAATEFRGVGRLGEVAVEGAYRQIKVDEAAALRLSAVEGTVQVGRLTGPAEVHTARGDIRVAEALGGKVVLRTESGDIAITAGAGVSAALDAGTGYGRVSNALRNTGPAELDIHATTGYGDVTAQSR